MADCCCPPRPDDPPEQQQCPRSGTQGLAVDLNTVKALLTSTALARITGSPHRFCPDPGCEIVYFSPGHNYTVQDLRVPVWQKEPGGARIVCYCFGENEADIRHEIEDMEPRAPSSGCAPTLRLGAARARCATLGACAASVT